MGCSSSDNKQGRQVDMKTQRNMTVLRVAPLVTAWIALTTVLCPTLAAGQSDRISIRAGVLLDGRGGMRENVDLIVQDGLIRSIVPSSGEVDYDLSGLTVMPGAIDTHVHINWHFDPDGKTHHLSREQESPDQAALYAVENAYQTLQAGITTVQSLGSRVDKNVRDAINRGTIPGPKILTSLQAINERTGSPDAIRQRVRQLKADGADVIKIFGSASIRVGGTPTLSQEQMDAACGEATAVGLRSAVHAHGPESAQRAVRAGCTVVEHGALLDQETLQLMARMGTYYDPNIHLIFRNYFENRAKYVGIGGYTDAGFDQMEAAVPRALEAFKWAVATPGLKIVFGTDAVAGAHGRNLEELIYRVEAGGQDPMEAIISATSGAAASIGLGGATGVLSAGMVADIIAVNGNPLENISALRDVRFVMARGSVARNDP
jgi:imidazolonepropionase-like amidohydrolase